jgi:hypothetical protein
VQLGLLAAGNLPTAVGGGRVTSAAKGVAGLTLLGSGALLAFLLGSAVGLGLVARYALWFDGRSLRYDLAALQHVSWLVHAGASFSLIYRVKGRPAYVHLKGLAMVWLK